MNKLETDTAHDQWDDIHTLFRENVLYGVTEIDLKELLKSNYGILLPAEFEKMGFFEKNWQYFEPIMDKHHEDQSDAVFLGYSTEGADLYSPATAANSIRPTQYDNGDTIVFFTGVTEKGQIVDMGYNLKGLALHTVGISVPFNQENTRSMHKLSSSYQDPYRGFITQQMYTTAQEFHGTPDLAMAYGIKMITGKFF